MPKNKGKVCPHHPAAQNDPSPCVAAITYNTISVRTISADISQGGKNRRRGKNENDNEKRELTFKEEGQGELCHLQDP